MRTITIMNRVLKELFRDKRTLALMFLAPILVLTLMNVVFSSNSSTTVSIGTVSVSKSVNSDLNKIKHVNVQKYADYASAKKDLKQNKLDAIIQKAHNKYTLTHANTDSSKTIAVKMAFKSALTESNMNDLKNNLLTSTTALKKVQKQLVTTSSALAKLQVQTAKANKQKSINESTKLPNQPQKETSVKHVSSPQVLNKYVYGNSDTGFFTKIIPILMSFFVFFFVFLISGMALLKERTSGTLDRLLATPVKRSEIVFGYMLSYGILATIQTITIVLYTVWVLGLQVIGNLGSVVFINLILALVALAFGILISTFANSEFQMMQFIPVLIIPQIFFSGIIPLDTMADWVKGISYVMPIKYSGDAVSDIVMRGTHITALGSNIDILFGFLIVLTLLNIIGLRRYHKV
ncbi:ABC transporter permease [Pediococcus inopinatus]|uniref:ABC transporter permease n=1 Tax=Pediococcus inopinatus TaxID=114090 RepID=UPI00070ED52B|nr:ABC transporter permease [Pediococcus inopinatus]AVL00021.1 antibiotic ABC transporter permease [Pediococcus inopinatus]KRN60896.1 ABC-type multidrug transport system, permease component [Pediococcus inopinatus]